MTGAVVLSDRTITPSDVSSCTAMRPGVGDVFGCAATKSNGQPCDYAPKWRLLLKRDGAVAFVCNWHVPGGAAAARAAQKGAKP